MILSKSNPIRSKYNLLRPLKSSASGVFYPPVTSRVLMSGHSLVDAIESGDGDSRQTWRTLRPASLPIGAWRRNTIPGSNMAIRWGNRFGFNYDGQQPPEPYPPFDVNNPESPVITARDMHEFDVFLITEAGPFALPLNPDRFNALWNDSKHYLDLWYNLATTEGISPRNFFFWTIWPAFNLPKDAEDDQTLPDYLAVCKRYNETAEEWCADKKIRIIPGHRIAAEIYTRIMDGRLPSHANNGRTWYRFTHLFDTAEDDLIHPTYLGSIFFAVGCYRHMFGVMPTDAQIQAMLDVPTVIAPYLNDPSFIARSITVNSQTADSIDWTVINSDARRTATWLTPPAGSRVQFTITSSANVYLRAGVDNGLGTGGYRDLISPSPIPAGTTNVDIILDIDTSVYPRFGFLASTVSQTVQITNWRVTKPHPYTLQHVKDTIEATTDYVQGEGVDLQVGSFVPPAPFLNFSQPLANQGVNVVGNGVVANTPVGPQSGIWKALPNAPVNQYALYELSFTDNNNASPIGMAQAPQGATWDNKFFGLELNGEGANYNMRFNDGGRFQQMLVPKPWTGDQHMIVEVNSGPLGSRIRALTDPAQWLPSWNERGEYWAVPDRFAVNLIWDSNNIQIRGGDFTIHRGLVYFEYPDELTRLRLIASFMDGIVP